VTILFIYCAGGFGKEVLDIALTINKLESRWSQILFVDDFSLPGSKINGTEVISFEQVRSALNNQSISFIIANGNPIARAKILDKLVLSGFKGHLSSIISPQASVSPFAYVEFGTVVCPGVIIATNARIDSNCVINCNSIIGHDVVIGANTVISSQVNLGGNVKIGNHSFIGMGSLVRERVEIGNSSIIGMGSAVHRDVPEKTLAMGNPARVIGKADVTNLYNQ
jgi:sugar O-acyltransferase (sialic acid O-acetyltransferase NeuD family)